MPYLPTAQSFLEQSRLLISARPTTARISTIYCVPNPNPSADSPRYKYTKAKPPPAPSAASPPPDSQQQQPSAKVTLTLKTYDPASGVCLKYQTDKAAEVGRLVAALGNCGRIMAALPDKEEVGMEVDETVKEEVVEGKALEAPSKGKAAQKEVKSGQGKGGEKGGGGGGGKKKKGKR